MSETKKAFVGTEFIDSCSQTEAERDAALIEMLENSRQCRVKGRMVKMAITAIVIEFVVIGGLAMLVTGNATAAWSVVAGCFGLSALVCAVFVYWEGRRHDKH